MSSLLQHISIRGLPPSKRVSQNKKKTTVAPPNLSSLQKNIQKITNNKKKLAVSTPSYVSKNILNNTNFNFFMENCFGSNLTQRQVAINTQECNYLLNTHNVVFIIERTQELSNSKVLFTTKTDTKKNNATFVLQLPIDYCELLVLYLLIKIDFGQMQVGFSKVVDRNISQFLIKSKMAGFKYIFDYIRLNVLNERFIVFRY